MNIKANTGLLPLICTVIGLLLGVSLVFGYQQVEKHTQQVGPNSVALADAALEGQVERAAELQRIAAPRAGELLRRWFIPGLKAVIDWRGGHGGAPRCPLEPLDAVSRAELDAMCAHWVDDGWLPSRRLG